MSQRSSQHKNLTPAIGIALAFLLSMSSLAGCSASMAADEAPTDKSTRSSRARGRPTTRKSHRPLPQRTQTSRMLKLLAKTDPQPTMASSPTATSPPSMAIPTST